MLNREDIIEMARENGFYRDGENTQKPLWVWTDDELVQFAALVAAAERERMLSEGWRQCAQGQKTSQFCAVAEQARAEEREACAKVCEDDPSRAYDWLGEIRPGGHYAAAIRARGQQQEDEDGNPSFG